MGTRDELIEMLDFVVASGLKPVIDQVRPLTEARTAFERLQSGLGFGKQVFTA